MSYWDIASMAIDGELTMREQAAAAQEDLPDDVDPQSWVAGNALLLAAEPGWADAWASAIASGVEHPGRDAGVITDGMILSAIQTLLGP